MTDSSHDLIGEVFLHACELEGKQRTAYLDRACSDDIALRAQVEKMLEAESAQPGGLSQASIKLDLQSMLADEDVPTRVGPYSIKRKIGSGGMGIVYEAEQEKPNRSVALKVLRWVDDPRYLARFELEAEVLGWLQHPAIAHIHGAGQSQLHGELRPWIAMEYVDGMPIDQYIKENALDERGILELIERVLDGISHAHSKGVVHRDLKPANILVDQVGTPRIVDFGVARLATQTDAATQTQAGEVVGTLAYMSPEQIGGDPGAVDTQSDIYAMGAIAYELLSGSRPIALEGASVTEAMRSIAQGKPKRLESVAQDLSTIVHTALAHDKGKRYPTAEAFSEDIRRYLANEVILARPPSALYQLRCFGRRNRLASIAMCASLLFLIGGGALSTYLYLKEQATSAAKAEALDLAREANVEVRKQAELTERGLLFYQNIIAQTNSGQMGRNVTLAELMHNASLMVPRLFQDSPVLQIQFLNTFSIAQLSAKRNDLALKDSEAAVRLLEEHVMGKPSLASQTYQRLGSALSALERHEEALAAAHKAVASVAQHTNPEQAYTYAQACSSLARAQADLGEFEASLEALNPAFEVLEQSDHSLDFPARLQQAKARALAGLDRFPDAVTAIREAIAYLREKELDSTPQWVDANFSLAQYLTKLGEGDAALQVMEPLPALEEKLNGRNRQWITMLKAIRGEYAKQGKHAEIAAALGRALASEAEPDTTTAFERFHLRYALGMAHFALKDFEQTDEALNLAVEELHGGSDAFAFMAKANTYNYLAQAASARGARELAIEYATLSCEASDAETSPPLDSSLRVVAYRFLSGSYSENEDWDNAARHALKALELSLELERDSLIRVQKNRVTLAKECNQALSRSEHPPAEIATKLAEIATRLKIELDPKAQDEK